jgi:hypothetical protein
VDEDEEAQNEDGEQLAQVLNDSSLKQPEVRQGVMRGVLSTVVGIFTSATTPSKRKNPEEANLSRKRSKTPEQTTFNKPASLDSTRHIPAKTKSKLSRPKLIYEDISVARPGQRGRSDPFEVPDDQVSAPAPAETIAMSTSVFSTSHPNPSSGTGRKVRVTKTNSKTKEPANLGPHVVTQKDNPEKMAHTSTSPNNRRTRSQKNSEALQSPSLPEKQPNPVNISSVQKGRGRPRKSASTGPSKSSLQLPSANVSTGFSKNGVEQRAKASNAPQPPQKEPEHANNDSDFSDHVQDNSPITLQSSNHPPDFEDEVPLSDSMLLKMKVQTMKIYMDSVGYETKKGSRKEEKSREESRKAASNGKYLLESVKIKSRIGKEICKTLDDFIAFYGKAHEHQDSSQTEKQIFQSRQTELGELFETLDIQSKSFLTDTPTPSDDKRGSAKTDGHAQISTDLYIHVFPKLVNVLNTCAATHCGEAELSTLALQEMLKLSEILKELLEKCGAFPTPQRPVKNSAYEFTRPSRDMVPITRDFIQKIKRVIASRRLAEADAELRRNASAHARRRKQKLADERLAEEAKYQKKVKERNKAIAASLMYSQYRYGLYKPEKTQEDKKSSSQTQRNYKARTAHEGSDMDNEWYENYDPLDEPNTNSQLEERVHMFGGRSQKNAPTARPWTNTEMETLIDGLRLLQGRIK